LRMRSDPDSAVRLSVETFLKRLPVPTSEPAVAAATAPPDLQPKQETADAQPAVTPAEPRLEEKTKEDTEADPTAEVQKLVDRAYAAIKSKNYEQADELIGQTRRLTRRAGKSPVASEVLYLQGMLYELRGQWREAVTTYAKYERIPSTQRRPQSAQAAAAALERLKSKMGHVLIFSMKDGQCEMVDDYYLPSGEHTISLGGGQSRNVMVEAGATLPIRQCP